MGITNNFKHMKTITLTKVEYINFLKVARQLAIDFKHQITSGFILITANADTLIELGY
jgi:hypothetical protein